MRYSRDAKRRYLLLCRDYNEASLGADADPVRFVELSVQLNIAKDSVPKSWGTASFIRRVGPEPVPA